MSDNCYKVSVIIPVYNAENYIRRCVCSLFNQTLERIEFVFVDDCSPDDSIKIIMQTIEQYPNRKNDVVIVRHSLNMGQAAARRSGLKRATGEYIGWCDADDCVEQEMFQRMYEIAGEQDADVVCCDIIRELEDGLHEEKYNYNVETKEDVVNHMEGGIYSALWNKLVRKSLYDNNAIDFIDGVNMWDDLSVTLPIRYLSRKTVIIHQPFYIYNNMNSASITASYHSLGNNMQRLKCVEHMINYFKSIMPQRHYVRLLEFCFEAKLFLFYPPYYNLTMWRTIIPETNDCLWRYSMSYFKKIKYWLMLYLPHSIADTLLKSYYKQSLS